MTPIHLWIRARQAGLLRRWERCFFRRLMRAVEDHQTSGDVSESLTAGSQGDLDRGVACLRNAASGERGNQVEDERPRSASAFRARTDRPPGILIADDEEAICFSLSRELRRQGLTAYVAADGLTALKVFQTHGRAIDVVFLDVRMPCLDGLATLAAMRRIDPAIRCCFMTAFSTTVLRDESGVAAVEVLKKPFDLDAFLSVAARLLGSQATEQTLS